MPAPIASIGLDAGPMLTLAAWPLLLGLTLILPACATALADAVRAVWRRGVRRASGRRHRGDAFLRA